MLCYVCYYVCMYVMPGPKPFKWYFTDHCEFYMCIINGMLTTELIYKIRQTLRSGKAHYKKQFL